MSRLMRVCLFLFLLQKPSLLCSSVRVEYGTVYAPTCTMPSALCVWEMSEKDQSEDPATFYSAPLVLTFKETLKG